MHIIPRISWTSANLMHSFLVGWITQLSGSKQSRTPNSQQYQVLLPTEYANGLENKI